MSQEESFELEPPVVSAGVQQKLEEATGDKKIRTLRFMAQQTQQYLQTIREAVKDVDNFWAFTLLSHVVFKEAASSKSDRQALTYLTDIELIQDANDIRPFELIFHFKENPFFKNKTLSKKYSLAKDAEAAPKDGSITKALRDFSSDQLEQSAIEIDWIDNLCEKYPRKKSTADDMDFNGDAGSFFHFFTEASDPWTIGTALQMDILPEAYDYFTGQGENAATDMDDSDEDELDEEDDDVEDEIDLEEEEEEETKRRKKQKTG